MLEKLAKLREEVLSKIDGSKNIEELNELKVKILGKKGEFTTIMKGMSEISAKKRAEFGKTTNEIKSLLNERFENKLTESVIHNNFYNTVCFFQCSPLPF